MLAWFDENPDRYWWMVCLVTFGALFALLRPLLRAGWQDARRTDWRWGLVIAGVLLAGRWPTWFITRQLDPDENQFIAGALTLRQDPVFWRSVDGMTSGPLDYYALLPAGWIHGTDDYLTARLTAFVLVLAALVFVHQACALWCGVMVARIAGFATLALEALALRGDFLHYSSELVPICLLGAAIWLMAARFAGNAGWRYCLAGGLALGSIPLAKLQAAPLAGLLALAWLAMEIRQQQRAGKSDKPRSWILIAGFATPLLACAAALTIFGLWPDMVISYLRSNAGYVGAIHVPLATTLATLWRTASVPDAMLPCWLAGSGLWLLLGLPLIRPRLAQRPLPLVGAAGFCVAALFCILVPRRPFLHYWQLLAVPWTLLFAAGMEAALRRFDGAKSALSRGLLLSGLVLSAGPLLLARAGKDSPFVGQLARYQAYPMGQTARELRKFARPGESLGVWGWMANFYAEADLRQATREAFSHMQILDNPYSGYYRRRYLADLQRSAPPVFVDAIGPVDLGIPLERLRHETVFPALAAYLGTRYTPVSDRAGIRIFVRNDRLTGLAP